MFYHDNPSIGHPPGYVHLYVKNTARKLYILIDDIPDNTSEPEDHLYIEFDCNYDDIKDSNISMYVDRDHGFSAPGNSLAKWEFGFGSTINNASDHSIIEIAINITMNSAYDGHSKPEDLNYILPVGTPNKSIRILFDAASYICNWSIPENGDLDDPTTYAEITFAPDLSLFLLLLLSPKETQAISFSNLEIMFLVIAVSVAGILIYISNRIKKY